MGAEQFFNRKIHRKSDTLRIFLCPYGRYHEIHCSYLLNILNTKGLLNDSVIKEIVFPLLTSCNLNENITLKEFYDYTGVELNLYTVNVNEKTPIMIGLSYKNYPIYLYNPFYLIKV